MDVKIIFYKSNLMHAHWYNYYLIVNFPIYSLSVMTDNIFCTYDSNMTWNIIVIISVHVVFLCHAIYVEKSESIIIIEVVNVLPPF